jgi:hypothetical protein
MYLESKHKGDDDSVGEELLMGISEFEQRARVVDKAVSEGYFALDEALSLYKVSKIEYFAYYLIKNKKKLEAISKQSQVISTASIIVSLFNEASIKFDPKVKRMMHQLEAITKDPSFKKVKVTS